MYFLDELENMKLYRRNVLLPIDEKDKRHNSMAYLVTPNMDATKSILYNPLLVGRYYNGYYIERAVMRYINMEGNIDYFDDEYVSITEAELFDRKSIDIRYLGYSHYISTAKKCLSEKWFLKQFEEYKINYRKIDTIDIQILEQRRDSTRDTIYLVPGNKTPSQFKTNSNYYHYCALMWIFYQANPKINDWLCMALALKESGVSSLYNKYNWKFNYNLGVICRALDTYEKDHSRIQYITDMIYSGNGLNKLNVSINDLLSLLGRDLQKEIESIMYESTDLPISDNMGFVFEDSKYNNLYKKTLIKNNTDKIKTIKDLKVIYDNMKSEFRDIKYCFNNLSMYKNLNLYVDLSHYNQAYLANTTLRNINGAKAYNELLNRLVNDKNIDEMNYKNKTLIIPVNEWIEASKEKEDFYLIAKSTNPLSIIYYSLINSTNLNTKDTFGDKDILFLGKSSFFKMNFSKLKNTNNLDFLRLIKKIANNEMVIDPGAMKGSTAISSARAIKAAIVDDIERTQKIKIDDISTDNTEEDNTELSDTDKKKKELVSAIDKEAKNKNTKEDTYDSIDSNEEESEKIKKLLSDLATDPDNGGSNISGARASRMLKLQNDFIDSEFEGKSIRSIVNPSNEEIEEKIEPVSLDLDSVNPEWKHLTLAATMDEYKLDEDMVRIFSSFYDCTNALVVRELTKEDTSTTGNLVETYTVKYESARGERYTIKVDIPKFVDNKYMVLSGNRKNLPVQLLLMPIIKTDEDTVQLVSCYKKIFIRRFGTTQGKSNVLADKLIKVLTKNKYKGIEVVTADNSKVSSKYELPIDYIDLSGIFDTISTENQVFMFNQDELRNKIKVDDSKGLCVGYNKKDKSPIYFDPNSIKEVHFFSHYLFLWIIGDIRGEDASRFNEDFNKANVSVRYTYSRASVLDTKIPLIVICGLAVGLEKTMQLANIKYDLSEKRPRIDFFSEDIIKFKDGYIKYSLDYASSLLMNGLKQCNTDEHSIVEINSRPMFLDFLDMFGGRIKADGLDNFYDCMIDPITKEALRHYKLPTDYISLLLHGNVLLSDNKFTKHGNIRASRRFRRMEQIASYAYEALTQSYGAYSTGLKHGRKVGFSIKQTAVIDRVLMGNTVDDQSVLNAVGEYESYYMSTPKGPSGMNSERSFSLDKRSYDDSMLNVLSSSTGFAGNAGIFRQITMGATIEGTRGYIYNDADGKTNKEINSVKTLCMTEALCPFSSTRDDPARLAMGFIQTSKHGMRCEKSDPLLITSGADEALPYFISNTFAFKAKDDGKVIEITDDYMIIEYKDKTHDYVNLQETVQKNSSSGFYVSLKLDTDLKVGAKVKKRDIVAYDRLSFDKNTGYSDNIAYNIGTLAKFALLSNDEGFEDSAIISDDLSEALSSDVVIEKKITIPATSNVYNMVKKGQSITEGDVLMILQNSYDEEDVNILLKNLGDEDEVTNLGRIPITSKITGVVQDIIIERTVDISELSPTLKKIVNSYEKEIKDKKKIMKSYGIEDDNKVLPDTEVLPPIGKLKNAIDSVVISIYLKYHDKFSVGCKMIYGAGVKGVDKDIFPKGLEPYSEYNKDEKIHSFLSIGSIDARMTGAEIVTASINKALIELSRRVKEMAGLPVEKNLL